MTAFLRVVGIPTLLRFCVFAAVFLAIIWKLMIGYIAAILPFVGPSSANCGGVTAQAAAAPYQVESAATFDVAPVSQSFGDLMRQTGQGARAVFAKLDLAAEEASKESAKDAPWHLTKSVFNITVDVGVGAGRKVLSVAVGDVAPRMTTPGPDGQPSFPVPWGTTNYRAAMPANCAPGTGTVTAVLAPDACRPSPTHARTETGLQPRALTVLRCTTQTFPQITVTHGLGSRPNESYHPTGEAVDFMIPGWNTPAGKALGRQMAEWAWTNRAKLGITEVIWDGRIITASRADEGWRPYIHPTGTSNPTLAHQDHVHVSAPNAATAA